MALFKNLFGRIGGTSSGAAERPSAADATRLRERGNAALAAGDLAQAGHWYAQASAADPQDALARTNLGFILLESGDLPGAQSQLLAALALRRPDQDIVHEIHYFLGRCLRAQGENQRALDSYKAAVQAAPAFAEPMEEVVQLLHESREHAQALEWALRLQAARPSVDSAIIVAQQLHHLGRNDEALSVVDAVVRDNPEHAAAWTGRGNVLAAMGRAPEAVVAFERALSIVGPIPDALANSGGALSRATRFDEALQRVQAALQLDPRHREALCNRLNILLEQVRVDEAAEAGREAAAVYPQDADIHWNLSIACLLAGRFEEGWREHEWRWQATASRAKHPLTSRGSQWTGAEDLAGRTILLFAEQGFGDSLQMLRYVPMVAARGARVLLHLPVGLHGLVLTSDLAPGVTAVPPGEPLPAFDFHCPLMSLPLAFGSNEATIPRDVPYLRVDPVRVDAWRRRLQPAGARLKVGVVWFGNAAHANDANRSIALSAFRELGVEGCFFVSLQQHLRDSDVEALGGWAGLHRWGEELVDFDDTAALIEALDLVISVDTSVAHLAGALGRPLWVLLPHCPDWRWMVGRRDSPWYPSARLFRQPRRQDWASVLAAVREQLQETIVREAPRAERALVVAPRPSWPELLQRAQSDVRDSAPLRALEALDAADAQAGAHPLALHARGNALFSLARYAEAADAFEGALARKPDLAEAAANAAAAWVRVGDADRGLARAEDALRRWPEHIRSLCNRIIALQLQGRQEEAVAAAQAAHAKFPADAELEWICGAAALTVGDYARGWGPLEARWQLPGAGTPPDAHELGCPPWTGVEPLDGRTLLLVAEQGAGDVFQFVRYAPELRRRGARVVLWMPAPVEELLRMSMPDCEVVPRSQRPPPADFHMALMSLPGALGTRLETIPANVPYLRAEPARVQAWRERLPGGGNLRVGVVWSGNPMQSNDANRSMSLAQLLCIEGVPGVQLVNLQREVRESDREALQMSGIWDPSADLHSFADTAALVESLDLVISVCTGVAHLAGAMGKPLWVMLARRADWRWLLDREDSPWYPTARLFRQPAPRAWGPVLERVRTELAQFARDRDGGAL
jgi:tetratricopeptide (TPR) repeat protein